MSPRLSPRTGDRGVTAVEYALIVFLVAIAMLIGVVLLQRSLGTAFAASADSAGGSVSTPSQTQSSSDSCPSDGEDDEDDDDCDDSGHNNEGNNNEANNNEANNNSTPTKPGAPTGVTAVRSANGEVTVSWTAPGSNGGRAITGYTVEFETETSASTCNASVTGWNDGSATAGSSATSAKETGLGSEWYCVRVYASNGVTSGSTNYAYAGPVYSAFTKPGAPTDVTALGGVNESITVSWTAPTNNGGSAITDFPIGYERDGVTASSTCNASAGDYRDETDSGAASDTSETESSMGSYWYCVRIAADNAASGSLNYAYTGPVYSGPVAKPGAPVNFAGSRVATGSVSLTWDAPASDGGKAVTGYSVQYEKDSIGSNTKCDSSLSYNDGTDTLGAEVTSTSRTGLGDTRVCVRISASNGVTTGTTNYAYVKVDARKP